MPDEKVKSLGKGSYGVDTGIFSVTLEPVDHVEPGYPVWDLPIITKPWKLSVFLFSFEVFRVYLT